MPLTDMIPNMLEAPPSEKPSTNNGTPSESSVTPTECLAPSELAYFKKVSEGLTRASQLERQAEAIRQQSVALAGAHASWVEHLVEQYHLDPEADQINEETGAIMRGAARRERES